MMRKNLGAISLALLLAASMTACASTGDGSEKTSEKTSTEPEVVYVSKEYFDVTAINGLIKDHVRGESVVDAQPLINPPIWIEMRVKSDEIMMKRFDKHKQQSLEYLGYDMEKAKREHFKRITFQRAQ